MYQSSNACGGHFSLFFSSLCMNTFVPDGPTGVELKSYVPLSWDHAEYFGFMREPLSRFNVNAAWGDSLSQR